MAVREETLIWDYIGLSTDVKPTRVGVGSLFWEYDTKRIYKTYDGTLWSFYGMSTGGGILATGTFTTSSATVPADTARTEDANQFKGCLLVPTSGVIANQPRLIVSHTGAGAGVFTLDPEEPFTQAPGLVGYVILAAEASLVPTADLGNNATTAHVVGNKADVAVTAVGAVASIVAYVKGLLNRVAILYGEIETTTLNAGAGSVASTVRQGLLVRWIADALNSGASGLAAIMTAVTNVFNRIGAPVGASVSADIAEVEANVLAVEIKLDGSPAIAEVFATTVTAKAGSVTLFQLDALGGPIRNINLNFYLALDAAATFSVIVQKTRRADLITFTQDEELDDTIALPAANRVHNYALGDLPEGLQMRVIIAQDNAGNATNAVDAVLTFEE